MTDTYIPKHLAVSMRANDKIEGLGKHRFAHTKDGDCDKHGCVPATTDPVPPMSEWPLTWECFVLSYMGRGRGRGGRYVDVPYRRCPHGGYWRDDTVCPPSVLNAWGIEDGLKQCPDGNAGPCVEAWREHCKP